MISILRQEFRSVKKRILFSALTLFCILLAGILVNITGYNLNNFFLKSFGMFLYWFCIFIGTCGFYIYAFCYGSGNIYRILLSDESVLTLLIPRPAYQILLGKLIINLMELLIYTVISFFMLSLLGPLASVIWKESSVFEMFGVKVYDINSNYWACVKGLYKMIFVDYASNSFQIFAMYILNFICYQTIFNFAYTLYASFIKNRKNKIVMILLLFAVLYFVSRFTINITGAKNALLSMWIVSSRVFVCSVILFFTTCVLMERKLEA